MILVFLIFKLCFAMILRNISNFYITLKIYIFQILEMLETLYRITIKQILKHLIQCSYLGQKVISNLSYQI